MTRSGLATRRPVAGLALVSALLTIGCTVNPAAEDTTSSSVDGLWLVGQKWPNGNVPICWDATAVSNPHFTQRSRVVRDIANGGWPTLANVDFTGWGQCPQSTAGMVRAKLGNSAPTTVNGAPGYSAAGVEVIFGIDIASTLITRVLGHVLGFGLDTQRADFVGAGTCTAGVHVAGDALKTRADSQSIMLSHISACNSNTTFSIWDAVGARNAYGTRTDFVRPLVTAYNDQRGDHATVSTAGSISNVSAANYSWAYGEGWIFAHQVPGTIPLHLVYSPTREDNFSATNINPAAPPPGYTYAGVEGYVFQNPQAGTVPLRLFWSPERYDNMLVATAEAEQNATWAGYQDTGTVVGHIPASIPYALLWSYWHEGRGDNLATVQNSTLSAAAADAGYVFTGFDGAILKHGYSGTRDLENYWNGNVHDHALLHTAPGLLNYGAPLPREGYVYVNSVPTGVEVKSFYSSTRGDVFTTMYHGSWASSPLYGPFGTEGHGIPIND